MAIPYRTQRFLKRLGISVLVITLALTLFVVCWFMWLGRYVVYDRENHTFREFSLHGQPVENARLYKIGLQYYFYLNMQDFFSVSLAEAGENGTPRKVATSCREVLDEYLSCHQNLDHHISGRLIIERLDS